MDQQHNLPGSQRLNHLQHHPDRQAVSLQDNQRSNPRHNLQVNRQNNQYLCLPDSLVVNQADNHLLLPQDNHRAIPLLNLLHIRVGLHHRCQQFSQQIIQQLNHHCFLLHNRLSNRQMILRPHQQIDQV